ncbi:cutC [Lepeophtheirus salmonis]|uniref:Copper homeostasis protein cutC homolog n=1 Tax=Lepeophtheirus salmonis TaxID=72036 RepID=A0A7R8CBK0_LEPSM|nr:cutC [Lepeophtheirus salmonis]CAF2757001.1 cutC [Lepeophtheirus salmonis]
MEVCIDNIKSLENILPTPAIRVELCSSLLEGGLTPSHGFHSMARRLVQSNSRPDPLLIFPIIRPRGGDFLYTTSEVSIMKRDIMALSPADGFVIGCLTSNGGIDVESCNELIKVAREKDLALPITFHRAFDMCKNPFEAVRILEKTGTFMIRDLVQEFPNMTFMAGGGINKDNLNDILETTRIKEFHASARSSYPSDMSFKNDKCYMGQSNRDEYSLLLTSQEKVMELTQIYEHYVRT